MCWISSDRCTLNVLISSAKTERLFFVPYDQAYDARSKELHRHMQDIGEITALIGLKPKVSLKKKLHEVNECQAEVREMRSVLSANLLNL